MDDLKAGVKGEKVIEVTPDLAINFLGLADARVLATPWLIMLLEMTARDSVKPLLPEGHDSVGTEVNVKHLAATPVGMRATFRSELISVDGRRLLFRVEAWDDRDKISEGTHQRTVIDITRFAERSAAKKPL
jgi:fluoroacetyl-CoA thioesterase